MQTISHDLCTAQWGRYHCVIMLQVRKYLCVQRDAQGMLVKLGFTWVHLVQKPVTTNMFNEYILETKFIVQALGRDFDKAGSM